LHILTTLQNDSVCYLTKRLEFESILENERALLSAHYGSI
jgi:hypothetical protein